MPKKPLRPHEKAVVAATDMLRQREQQKPKPFTSVRDFTATPKALERAIDTGQMVGCVTFYKLKDGHLGMLNGGFAADVLFDTICELRRTMIATQGMVDEDETEAVRRLRAEVADLKMQRDGMTLAEQTGEADAPA